MPFEGSPRFPLYAGRFERSLSKAAILPRISPNMGLTRPEFIWTSAPCWGLVSLTAFPCGTRWYNPVTVLPLVCFVGIMPNL